MFIEFCVFFIAKKRIFRSHKKKIMKTKIFTIVLLAFVGLSSNTNAQSPNWLWAKSAGGTGGTVWGNSISTDANGNSYITGEFGGSITFGSTTLTGVGSTDVFVVKYDGAGNLLWAKSAGGNVLDWSNSISTDANGNSYIIGWFNSTITFGSTILTSAGWDDIFVVKYDGAGNVLWAKSAGGANHDHSKSISTDANGNSYITGEFGSPTITFGSTTLTNDSLTDIFVVKYDSSGNELWAKSAGGNDYECGESISADASGNSYITGHFESPTINFGSTTLTNAGGMDIFIVKYDGVGNVLWAKSAGGINFERGYSISTDASGNSYITGHFYGFTCTFGSTTLTNCGSSDIFVVKYDGTGNVLWAKSAGGTSCDYGFSINTDASGNSHITGGFESDTITFGSTTLTNTAGSDIFVAKLDNVTGIAEDNESFNAITIFPNPANGNFTVNSKIKISKIEVINVQGKKVYTSKINTAQSVFEGLSTEIDLSNEAKGIYFVNIIAGEKTYNSKIIIQ